MKQGEIIRNELNFFANYPKVFTVEDVAEYVDLEVKAERVHHILQADARFLSEGMNYALSKGYVSKGVVTNWFVHLSVKLAKAKKSSITTPQFCSVLSSLGIVGQEITSFSRMVVDFGESVGFIRRSAAYNMYFFPLAHVISFVESYPSKAIFDIIKHSVDHKYTPSEESMLNCIRLALSKLSSREAHVLINRSDIGAGSRTLEDISVELGCTRERVRQIEKTGRARSSLVRPFLTALVREVIARKGSLVYEQSSRLRIITFIAWCLNIPHLTLPGIGLVILGASEQALIRRRLPAKARDKYDATEFLKHEFQVFLSTADAELLADRFKRYREPIADRFKRYREPKAGLVQRLYLTLKLLGRPAHYSTITDTHNSLFPQKQCLESTILNALGRERYAPKRDLLGIVWIGAKGMYALKEWGYERPTKTLYETVADIVEEKYKNTRRPVPLEVIAGELGKYRKFINPSSGLLAISLNPALKEVSRRRFLLKSACKEGHNKDETDHLDAVLAEFEKEHLSVTR